MSQLPKKVLCISSYFKGNRFLERMHERGVQTYLLTLDTLLDQPWSRHALTDVFGQPPKAPIEVTKRIVGYLMRELRFDKIVALDDFDVEGAAELREMLRMPGMNVSTARLFRDKLAMRQRARELGIPVPDFTGLFNNQAIDEFTSKLAAPWMLKMRGSASAVGITKVRSPEQLWQLLDELGDGRLDHLLEQYLPGDVFHVDSLVAGGKILLEEVHQCDVPPFDIAHGGGVYSVTTVRRGSDEERQLRALNRRIIEGFGLQEGASHIEFIRGPQGFAFLECGARVGGAHTTEMIEAAIGYSPWALWADLSIDGDRAALPELQRNYGGLALTLSKDERPDLRSFDAPEVFFRSPEHHHAGLVVRADSFERVRGLVDEYRTRLADEHTIVLPVPDEVAH